MAGGKPPQEPQGPVDGKTDLDPGRYPAAPLSPADAKQGSPGRRMVSIGGGRKVPYASPTSIAATRMGKGNRRADTRAEIALRSELHRRGLRFRKDYPVPLAGQRPVRADIVFTKARVLVFVDGCFWHCCPEHFHPPKSNQEYWTPKLKANQARDRLVNRLCRQEGWTVIRVWEHESITSAADRINSVVRRSTI